MITRAAIKVGLFMAAALSNPGGWHLLDRPRTSVEIADALGPYYQYCIDSFGAERCLFESNSPR